MRAPIVIAEGRGLVRAGLAGLLGAWSQGPVHAVAALDAALHALPAEEAAVLLLDLDLLGVAGPSDWPWCGGGRPRRGSSP